MDRTAQQSYTGEEYVLRNLTMKKEKTDGQEAVSNSTSVWVTYTPAEVERLIVKLVKQDKTASQIGMILRDTYGIPSVRAIIGKRVTEVLRVKKISKKLPEDILALIRRHIAVMKQYETNKHDHVAQRGATLVGSKIQRLVAYYKSRNVLPKDWSYDRTQAKLYLE